MKSNYYIDINVDVGEGLNNEAELIPHLSSCNIACGGHAGNLETMKTIVKLADTNGVKIGAHPSFPDKVNFGREIVKMTSNDLFSSLKDQITALQSVLYSEKTMLHHIKPHGALYNLATKDESTAKVIVEVVKRIAIPLKLYAPQNSIVADLATRANIEVVFEAFADRNYNEDLSLVSRKNNEAMLTKKEVILEHVLRMVKQEKVKTISGVEVALKASTFCVHGDTKNASEILKYLAEELNKNHILIR